MSDLRTPLADPALPLVYTVEIHGHDAAGDEVVSYFATRLLETSSADTPPDTPMRPFLLDPGGVSQDLGVDQLLGGIVQPSFGPVVLDNPDGELDSLANLRFAGAEIILRYGFPGLAHADFEPAYTARIPREPSFGAMISFDVESRLTDQLTQPLRVPRYIGIPTAFDAAQGSITVPQRVEYDVEELTVAASWRDEDEPNGQVKLLAKGTSYSLEVAGAFLRASSALQDASTLLLEAAIPAQPVGFHRAVFSLGALRAYLMLDGKVVAEAVPAAPPSTAAAAIDLLLPIATPAAPFLGLDCRLYGRYLPSEEALAALALPVSVDSATPGLLGAWQLDDPAGLAVTDRSELANHGTATAEGWVASGEGDPELAGQAHQLVLGAPTNAPTQHQDRLRSEYRVSSPGDASIQGDAKVKSRGVDVVGSFDSATQTFTATAGQPDDPVTVAVEPRLPPSPILRFPSVLQKLLVGLGPFDAQDLLSEDLAALEAWRPTVSLVLEDAPTLQEALGQLLTPLGGGLTESRAGHIRPGFLLPPLSPGPYGDPVLDFRNLTTASVDFGAAGNIAGGAHTVTLWFKSLAEPQALPPSFSTGPVPGPSLLRKESLTGGYYLGLVQEDPSRIVWHHPGLASGESLVSPAGLVEWGQWHFVMVSWSPARRRIWLGKEGDPTLTLIRAELITGAATADSTPALRLGGGFLGALSGATLWNQELNGPQGEAPLAAPPVGTEPGLVFHAPLQEGVGATADRVGSAVGQITAARWRPDLTLNLDEVLMGSSSPQQDGYDQRHLRPLAEVLVRWGRNHAPLSESDVAGAVQGAERDALLREWQELPVPGRAPVPKNAARLQVETPLTEGGQAARLGQRFHLRTRDRGFATALADRRALPLEPLDEVRLVGSRLGHTAGRSFRVASIRQSLGDARVELGLWGELPRVPA